MAYEKQTWQTGDIITANRLNHMEDGIADGGGVQLPIVHIYETPEMTTTVRLDESFSDLAAMVDGYSGGKDALAYISPVSNILETYIVHISGVSTGEKSSIAITHNYFSVDSDSVASFTCIVYSISSDNSVEKTTNYRRITA